MTKLTLDAVRALVGDYDDVVLAAIVATGASRGEILQAAAWLRDDEEVEGPRTPLTGKALEVLEILEDASPWDEDDERRG